MSYRDVLLERVRREAEHRPEPQVLNYLQHRNDDALRAWRERQFQYERGRLAEPCRQAS